ncbi:MAG TPA: hypothetical protein VLZ83_16880 [Edaphocola sp.]|nr:hypothetical protein [Edaphocola sp.]
MKKTLFSFCLLLLTINGIAQKNNIDFSFNPKIWLNQYDVYHDEFMNDAIQNRNAMPAASFNFDYSHKTPYGLIYGAGIRLGFYQESFDVIYRNLAGFRADHTIDHRISITNFYNRYGYASIGATFGYSKKLNKQSNSIDILFGIMKMLPFNGEDVSGNIAVSKQFHYEETIIANYDWGKGSGGYAFSGPYLLEGAIVYHFTPFKTKRSFFVGINSSINAFFFNAPGRSGNTQSGMFILNDFYTDIDGNKSYGNPDKIYGEVIANKFISLGVKLGMNLYNF